MGLFEKINPLLDKPDYKRKYHSPNKLLSKARREYLGIPQKRANQANLFFTIIFPSSALTAPDGKIHYQHSHQTSDEIQTEHHKSKFLNKVVDCLDKGLEDKKRQIKDGKAKDVQLELIFAFFLPLNSNLCPDQSYEREASIELCISEIPDSKEEIRQMLLSLIEKVLPQNSLAGNMLTAIPPANATAPTQPRP